MGGGPGGAGGGMPGGMPGMGGFGGMPGMGGMGGMGGGPGGARQERPPSEPLYSDADDVIELTPKNIKSIGQAERGRDVWLVECYAPWNEQCKKMAPTFMSLAASLKGIVKVGAVDCDAHPAIARKLGAENYPTIKILYEGGSEDYTGKRTKKAIAEAATAKLSSAVTPIAMTGRNGVGRAAARVRDALEECAAGDKVCAFLFTSSNPVSHLFKAVSTQYEAHAQSVQVTIPGDDTEAEAKEAMQVVLGGKVVLDTVPQLVCVKGAGAARQVTALTENLKYASVSTFLDTCVGKAVSKGKAGAAAGFSGKGKGKSKGTGKGKRARARRGKGTRR